MKNFGFSGILEFFSPNVRSGFESQSVGTMIELATVEFIVRTPSGFSAQLVEDIFKLSAVTMTNIQSIDFASNVPCNYLMLTQVFTKSHGNFYMDFDIIKHLVILVYFIL